MDVFQLISIYSPLLPLVLFVLFCLKNSTVELKVIFFYILLSIGSDIYTTSTAFGKIHIFGIQAIYTIVEYLCLSSFFYLGSTSKIFRRVILGSSLLFFIYATASYVKLDKTRFDSIGSSLENVLLITFCIIYFFEQLNTSNPEFIIYRSPNFWVVLAILVYMAGTLFLFIISGSLSQAEKNKYWFINNFLTVVFNIFLSIAFMLNKKTSKLT